MSMFFCYFPAVLFFTQSRYLFSPPAAWKKMLSGRLYLCISLIFFKILL